MKIPEYIKVAIEKNAIYAMQANENNEIIRNWLEGKGISHDNESDDVIDMLIDCVENNCNPTTFINFLKRYELK